MLESSDSTTVLVLVNIPHCMPTCGHCGQETPVESLVRHEHETGVVVHCPDCNCVLGRYRDPSVRSR